MHRQVLVFDKFAGTLLLFAGMRTSMYRLKKTM
jgi:hypothetical protein